MNKKITLYELLGLFKDGKAPKKIKLCEETFIFVDGRYFEEHHINDDNGRMGDYFALDGMLNDEVEILDDEDMEIEELRFTGDGKADYTNVIPKINELVREINKLKKEGK